MRASLMLFSVLFSCARCVIVNHNSNIEYRRAIPPLPILSDLDQSVRQFAQCERNDSQCLCLKAVEYTNDVRRNRGLSILQVGTEKQLRNAIDHAQKLSHQGRLEHQDFAVADTAIGCGRALGGENVALNYQTGDLARACVDQWISSPGHLENIVRSWFLEVVVGFAFDNNGGVFCVQTFAVTKANNGQTTDSGCQPVQRRSGSTPVTIPPPPQIPVAPPAAPAAPPAAPPTAPPTTAPSASPSPSPTASLSGPPSPPDQPPVAAPAAGQPSDSSQDLPSNQPVEPPTEPPAEQPSDPFDDFPQGPLFDDSDDPSSPFFEPPLDDNPIFPDELNTDFTGFGSGIGACQCIRNGKNCNDRFVAESGNVCFPGVVRYDQPLACMQLCCDHCLDVPFEPECRNGAVRGLCRQGIVL